MLPINFRHFTPPNIAAYFGLGFFVLILYWLLWPFPSIDIEQPIPMVKDTYTTGEIADFDVTYCKYIDAGPRITRTLVYVDKPLRRSYTDIQGSTGKSAHCPETIRSISNTLSEDLPSGRARWELVYRYSCSPLQVCTKKAITTEFMIVNDDEGIRAR